MGTKARTIDRLPDPLPAGLALQGLADLIHILAVRLENLRLLLQQALRHGVQRGSLHLAVQEGEWPGGFLGFFRQFIHVKLNRYFNHDIPYVLMPVYSCFHVLIESLMPSTSGDIACTAPFSSLFQNEAMDP